MRPTFFLIMVMPVILFIGCRSDRHAGPAGAGSTPKSSGVVSSSPGSVVSETDELDVDREFRQHYDKHYGTSGYGYNQYRPAYRYGFDLAADPRYRTQDWSMGERIAWRGWDSSKMGDWEQYKDAVRYGWDLQRSKR